VEKIFIVREETEKILLSMMSNDPYSARLLRSIASLAGVPKDMTFRKIISSDDVDSFIGCEDKKISLCFFITSDDEIYIKRDSSLRVSPVTIILCNLKVVRRDASTKSDFYVPYISHFHAYHFYRNQARMSTKSVESKFIYCFEIIFIVYFVTC